MIPVFPCPNFRPFKMIIKMLLIPFKIFYILMKLNFAFVLLSTITIIICTLNINSK